MALRAVQEAAYMRMVDLIIDKREGKTHTREEINYIIREYTAGNIPDYQMSAWLMAVCWQGMTEREVSELTSAMMHSGDVVDLSDLPGIKVDKHSTGGVGDTTTLVIALSLIHIFLRSTALSWTALWAASTSARRTAGRLSLIHI